MSATTIQYVLLAGLHGSDLRAIDGVDVRLLLPRVAVPLLYLQAARDRLVWPRFGRELVARVPHGELHRIDGAHMLLHTAPPACWAAIAGFAARLPADPGLHPG